MLKKIILGLIILISSFYLISCNKLEDVIPEISEYGNWDGNYIYFENYKCKTTGEDEQILIPEFVYEEITYEFDDVTSYKIINNNIYMNMRTKTIDSNDHTIYHYFIIKYSIEEQNYQIIKKFDSNEGSTYRIVGHASHYVVLVSYDLNSTQDKLTILNTENNQMSIIENINYYKLLDNYLVIAQSAMIKYANIEDLIFTEISTYENAAVFLVKKDGKQYFRILKSKDFYVDNIGLNYYNELEYYDIETKKLHILISEKDKKHITFINEEYFFTKETKVFEYYLDDYNSKSCIKQKKLTKELLDVNNKICQIDFENMKVIIKYEFDNKNANYEIDKKINNYLVLTEETIKKGTALTDGGYRYSYYELNLDNFKLTNINVILNNSQIEVDNSDDALMEITYNNISYYIDIKKYGPLLARDTAHYLYSYDEETKVETLLQFYIDDGTINVEYGRASIYFGDILRNKRFNNEHFCIYNK